MWVIFIGLVTKYNQPNKQEETRINKLKLEALKSAGLVKKIKGNDDNKK